MIYLNQAGTSWPKPSVVLEALPKALALDPETLKEKYHVAHKEVCEFFNIPKPEGFLFTTSCTSAIDLAISHLNLKKGDKIITSALEHHALSRCLSQLTDKGVSILKGDYAKGAVIDLDWVREELKKGGVKMIALSHGSNVTGELLPVSKLCSMAHDYDALFLMDGAQTAGTLPIDLQAIGVDLFVFAGHKGMLSPQGIGGLYIDPKIKLTLPSAYCDLKEQQEKSSNANRLSFCDTGSVNMAGVVGLAAGVNYLKNRGLQKIREDNLNKTKKLINCLSNMPLDIYGDLNAQRKTTALAFNPKSKSAKNLLEELKKRKVQISHGFQCSPWTHEALGTLTEGVFRVSAGVMNDDSEVDLFIEIMQEVL